MSRPTLHSARGRWLLAFFVCAVLTVAVMAFGGHRVKVAVYNDSQTPWTQARLTVGGETRMLRPLAPREGVVEAFSPLVKTADVELTVDETAIIHWKAPWLVRSDTARVVIHVRERGEVAATAEGRLFQRLLKFMD